MYLNVFKRYVIAYASACAHALVKSLHHLIVEQTLYEFTVNVAAAS